MSESFEVRGVKITAQARMGFEAQQRVDLDRWLGTMVDKRVDITLREHRDRRTNAQNARYWALLTVAAKDLWGDPSLKNALHEEVAHLLLGLPDCPKTGMRRRQRTPALNTKDFADYTDLVADKLVELGANLSEWDAETRKQDAA